MDSRANEPITIIPGLLDIESSFNTGVAFGLFSELSPVMLFVPTILVIAVLIYVFFRLEMNFYRAVSISLIAGGAIGNAVDRISAGKVYDFIDVYIGNYHWPTFNAADCFIVAGVILILIEQLREVKNETKNRIHTN